MKLNSLIAAMSVAGIAPVMAWASLGAVAQTPAADGQAISRAIEPAAAARLADTQSPKVRISGGAWVVAGQSHSLTGWVSDDVAVSKVVWHNTRTGLVGTATLSGAGTVASWTIGKIPVVAGANLIYVAAFDAAGNKTRIETTITVNATTSDGTVGPCAGFYPAGFQLAQGKLVQPWATTPQPQRGIATRGYNYGTCQMRLTDRAADGLPGYARNDYSRKQPFNADDSAQLIAAGDGSWHLYEPATGRYIRSLSYLPGGDGLAGDAEPQWDPLNRDLLYYMNSEGVGMLLRKIDVKTGVRSVQANFAARLKARWPTAASASTAAEGSPSADGRYWCLMVKNSAGSRLGIFTWDKTEDRILGMADHTGHIDNVSMSPSGNYCVVNVPYVGTTVWPRDLSSSRQITNDGQHSDMAIDKNGDDVYVSNYLRISDPVLKDGDVYMYNLRTGQKTTLFSSYLNGTTTAMHFSGRAFAKPGWVVMGTQAEGCARTSCSQQWAHRKIMVVELAANPRIYNIADTRVSYVDYDSAPVPAVNRSLTKIAWNSNWGRSAASTETYNVQIPSYAIPER